MENYNRSNKELYYLQSLSAVNKLKRTLFGVNDSNSNLEDAHIPNIDSNKLGKKEYTLEELMDYSILYNEYAVVLEKQLKYLALELGVVNDNEVNKLKSNYGHEFDTLFKDILQKHIKIGDREISFANIFYNMFLYNIQYVNLPENHNELQTDKIKLLYDMYKYDLVFPKSEYIILCKLNSGLIPKKLITDAVKVFCDLFFLNNPDNKEKYYKIFTEDEPSSLFLFTSGLKKLKDQFSNIIVDGMRLSMNDFQQTRYPAEIIKNDYKRISNFNIDYISCMVITCQDFINLVNNPELFYNKYYFAFEEQYNNENIKVSRNSRDEVLKGLYEYYCNHITVPYFYDEKLDDDKRTR